MTASLNGDAPPSDTEAIDKLEQQITVLTQQMTRLAAAVAGLLAQSMQPQMQRNITEQILGHTQSP